MTLVRGSEAKRGRQNLFPQHAGCRTRPPCLVFLSHQIAYSRSGGRIRHRFCLHRHPAATRVYRSVRIRSQLPIPAAGRTAHRTHIGVVPIDDNPDHRPVHRSTVATRRFYLNLGGFIPEAECLRIEAHQTQHSERPPVCTGSLRAFAPRPPRHAARLRQADEGAGPPGSGGRRRQIAARRRARLRPR